MRVRILAPFTVETAGGPLSYAAGQIVPNGQKNWVDKGLAEEARPGRAATEKSDGKS